MVGGGRELLGRSRQHDGSPRLTVAQQRGPVLELHAHIVDGDLGKAIGLFG